METSTIDDLYGDLGQDIYDSALCHDENSVDIYSGLEDSPRPSRVTGKGGSSLSPRRLKESMDLYEQLIAEEQEEKESTYNELKSKFDAAQNQMQELLAKLELMQKQNSSLYKENTLLKKNFSALIKTARMEIVRKDEEISQLSNRHSWGGHHQYRAERSQGCTRRSLNNNSLPTKDFHERKEVEALPEASQHEGGSRLCRPPVYPGTSSNVVPTPFSVLPRCTRSDPVCSQNKNSDGMDSLYPQPSQNHKSIRSDQISVGKEREITCSEAAVLKSAHDITANHKVLEETSERPLDGREGGKECHVMQSEKQIDLSQGLGCQSNQKDISGKPQSKGDKNHSQKEQQEPSERSQEKGSRLLRRSGRSKSPSSLSQPVSTPALHLQTSRGPTRESTDAHTQGRKVGHLDHREDRRSGEPEGSANRRGGRGHVRDTSCLSKSVPFPDRNAEKRGSREHHRKEERRPEDVHSSERRRTRSDGSREHKNTQQSEGSRSRGEKRSTRSETIKEHEQRSTKGSDRGIANDNADKVSGKHDKDRRNRSHADVRESRRDASIKHGVHSNSASRRKDEQVIDRRKASGRTEEQASRSKASCDQSGDGKCSQSNVSHASSDSSSIQKKSVDVDYEKDSRQTDKAKEMTSLDKKGLFLDENTRSASPEKCRIREAAQTECVANVHVETSPLPLNGSCDVPAMAEESSPKRKLTFMETLNLTLSPVKKQSQPAADNEPVGSLPMDALEGNSFEDRVSFELGEGFCVIDEIENSQLPIELTDGAPATTSDAIAPDVATHLAPSSLDIQPNETQDVSPSSTEPSIVLRDTGGEEKALDLPQRFDGGMNESLSTALEQTTIDSEAQEKEAITEADDSDQSATGISPKCVEDSQCVFNKSVVAEVHFSAEESEAVVGPSIPLAEAVCKELDSQFSTKKLEEARINSSMCRQVGGQSNPEVTPPKQSDSFQEDVSTSVDTQVVSNSCCDTDTSVSLDVVSSTVSVEINHQNQDNCADNMEITRNLEKPVSCPKPLEGPWADVVSISSTSTDEGPPPEQTTTSEPDSTENEGQNSKPSSSTVGPHDEDSMMLILSNIKVIPEAISPLTSPVRQTKNVEEQHLGKEMHVKSLTKDFSASAIVSDKDSWKTDMNKENKRPCSSVRPNVLKDQPELPSYTTTEEELEEGEIVSESDEEEGTLVIQSPQNDKNKRELRSSPRSSGLEKQTSQTRSPVTPKRCKQGKSASKDSPSFNKRRFKTVTAPSKANIATFTDFMNTLSFIRSELRRKYMKLHKNVTKPAFCCIVEMSLASFIEFVDGINFHRFCSQGNDIKSRLNKIIISVMSKVSNNGIVNRIFDQRADDLKQKLWNFVDGQFDFLFKELKAALKSVCERSKSKSAIENKCSNPTERADLNAELHKAQTKEAMTVPQHRRIIKAKVEKVSRSQESQKITTHVPQGIQCRARGLGCSDKNIKATMEEVSEVPAEQISDPLDAGPSSEKCLPEVIAVPENTASTYSRRLSHSGSMQDRSDFEILTEQQTSSLTFNLVTDSQMGDIFRCLLQGSDLLEASVGDHQSWPLNTPRKEGSGGESLIGVVTPSKIITPSKLITWTSISPYKFTSPNGKIQMPLNPALLDESCLLEVPSNPLLACQASPALTIGTSQQPFSILTEDLAVSLTIPSPLKSDGHLSFLHPQCGQPPPVPSSVITAHYGEDALLDGEDATEQDIHLSLDTDNSSCGSSTGGTWIGADPAAFQFKANLPMQAEIMERSNDHFIVRIRHTSPGSHEEPTPVQKEAPSAERTALHEDASSPPDQTSPLEAHPLVTSERTEVQTSSKGTSSSEESGPASWPKPNSSPAELAATGTANASCTSAATEGEDGAPEAKSTCERMSRKRRKRYSGSKEKRSRREKSQDGHHKQRHKKRSKSSKHRSERTPSNKGTMPGSPQLSPNSLSAKNIIRKKGEVVVTWTREEDRNILIELKTKGATLKTFTELSTKLGKSPAQIEDRFTQLLKLFKKKEKMEC